MINIRALLHKIINNLDIFRPIGCPNKTDAPLVIDAGLVPISLKFATLLTPACSRDLGENRGKRWVEARGLALDEAQERLFRSVHDAIPADVVE